MLKINQEYIKSPINYVGNKYRLIKQIIPLFPKKISMFVDAFGGSGTVLMNTEADHYIYNDVNPYVSGIVSGLFSTPYDEIIKQIESIISEYDLSMTNKEGFERLRDDYNNGRKNWITLYTLMCHSFNHQFRFNSKHEYNSSFGKNRSYFSDRQRQDLLTLKQGFENKEPVTVLSKNVFDFDFSDFDKNDLIYFDPPYFNSVGNYNDGKRGFEGWTAEHERKLYELLDKLDEQGTRWVLSNNLKYDNEFLDVWKDKYNIHCLSGDYLNCNYHKKDRETKDVEVLITNY
jgi:DNA adenine methylase Dam|nr:MAG TPA: adenine-specific methyltransferase [Caudoviricetes sp.]